MSDAQDLSERREPVFGTPGDEPADEVRADHAGQSAREPAAEPVSQSDAARLMQAVEEVLAPRDSRAVRTRRLIANMFRLAIERSHTRVALVGLVFLGVFGTISGRLLTMAIFGEPPSQEHRAAATSSTAFRPDIVDRNGEILATDIRTVSVFAEPGNIYDKDEAVELLTAVLPSLNASELRAKLASRKDRKGAGFVWVKRELTPKQQAEVHRLGIQIGRAHV